jgi:hypothetical protein
MSKRFTFVSPAEFERKRNNAIMINKIFNIMKGERVKDYVNHGKLISRF